MRLESFKPARARGGSGRLGGALSIAGLLTVGGACECTKRLVRCHCLVQFLSIMAAALPDPSRTVVLAVGAKETSDTILLWRFCNAHILEHETDKVIVVHVRSASALPTSWAPLNMALSFSADGAR